MTAAKQYSFHPAIGERRYSDIADQVSIMAMHVFILMRDQRHLTPLSFEQIETIIQDAGHFPATPVLRQCLLELEQAKCLVVEEQRNAARSATF